MHEAERLIRSWEQPLPVTAEQLVAALVPRVGFTSSPRIPRGLPLGASRFGGPADLPAGVVWPTADGRPLLLLTQLNFGSLPIRRGEHPMLQQLPTRGWFCLFLDVDWDGNLRGTEGDPPGVVAMQFDGPADALIRHDPEPALDATTWTHCHAVTVGGDHHLCLPDARAVDSPLLDADHDAFEDAYRDLQWKIEDAARIHHEVTLLGTPTLFNPDLRHVQENPDEWMLLLQFAGECSWIAGVTIPSEPYLNRLSFGSADFVQYFVRKSDLAAGRLDRGFLDYMMT